MRKSGFLNCGIFWNAIVLGQFSNFVAESWRKRTYIVSWCTWSGLWWMASWCQNIKANPIDCSGGSKQGDFWIAGMQSGKTIDQGISLILEQQKAMAGRSSGVEDQLAVPASNRSFANVGHQPQIISWFSWMFMHRTLKPIIKETWWPGFISICSWS